MSSRFELYVSYSQIAVFRPQLERPFSSWTTEQVEKGYSWALGSVSFKTPTESGVYSIEVLIGNRVDTLAAKAIEVPFEVPLAGQVEVASISDGRLVSVPSGPVVLRYEVVQEDFLRLTFIYAGDGRGP